MAETLFRTTRTMNLRGDPSTEKPPLRVLPQSEILHLVNGTDPRAKFVQVVTSDGTTGFAARSLLETVVAGAKVDLTSIDLGPWRDPHGKQRDTAVLHPEFRLRAQRVVARCESEGIPFGIFEAFRSPWRQALLFAQGRTTKGPIVTKARPWESYHQYGLAADFVLMPFGPGSWDDSGPRAAWWNRLRDIARAEGLEDLSFERPHFQLRGLTIAGLRAGKLPVGGDDAWRGVMNALIGAWDGPETAPPPIPDPD